jgi:hypothetical protein
VTAGASVDQNQLIAQLERHDDKSDGGLVVGKTRSAQRHPDLLDANVPYNSLPQRDVTDAINQRKDLNVANRVFAEGLSIGLLSGSRTNNLIDPPKPNAA